MNHCRHCNSTALTSRGLVRRVNETKRRYQCKDCGKTTYVLLASATEERPVLQASIEKTHQTFKLKQEHKDFIQSSRRFVVTSAQIKTPIVEPFFEALLDYCGEHDAVLIVIPVRYNNTTEDKSDENDWDERLLPYLVEDNLYFPGLKVMAACPIQATAYSPLTTIDQLCEGLSTIVGHPQLQMKTVPVSQGKHPITLHTTGSLTIKTNYSDSKAGYRAKFNHCLSAVNVEYDDDGYYHIRQLCADSTGGFFDLDTYYGGENTYGEERCLVLGDEHVTVISDEVTQATFYGKNSIVGLLKPTALVRHDVLDCGTITHHDKNNFIRRYEKFSFGNNNIHDELNETIDHLVRTTPEGTVSMVVSSNHNNHLTRWLNDADPKQDPTNAKIYHKLMWMVLSAVDEGRETIDPFELYAADRIGEDVSNIVFLRDDNCSFKGINISMHGDIGPNGARGTRHNLSTIGERSMIGHSHSPGIEKGCWQVGTSSELRLDYNKGPSSWMNTHGVIHPNGKRQLISIIGGRWRSK